MFQTGPSCRSLFLQFGDTQPAEFRCFNLKCGMIKHKDLEKVFDKDDSTKIDRMGYRCRKCKQQQRKGHLEQYKNDEFMDNTADKYIEAVENEFSSHLNGKGIKLKQDKERIKELILFVMDPDQDKALFSDTVLQFLPNIAKWIKNYPGFQEKIADKKDDIIEVVLDTLDAPYWTKEVVNGRTLSAADEAMKMIDDVKGDVDEIAKGNDAVNRTVNVISSIAETTTNIIRMFEPK